MSKRVSYSKSQVSVFLKVRFPEVDWTETITQLPPVIWRSRWDKLADRVGLPYTRKYIQNLDSLNEGPSSYVIEGRAENV